jgi:hypothetical protein
MCLPCFAQGLLVQQPAWVGLWAVQRPWEEEVGRGRRQEGRKEAGINTQLVHRPAWVRYFEVREQALPPNGGDAV